MTGQVLDVATTPALLQTGSRRLRQSQGIIRFAACQESRVRGSDTKFQADSAVELELQRAVGALHLWDASSEMTVARASSR